MAAITSPPSRENAQQGPDQRMHRRGRIAGPRGLGAAVGQLRTFDAGDDHRDVIRAAPQIAQIDQGLGRLLRRQAGQDHADLLVFDMARQPVAANQEGVAGLERKGPLEIDLNRRVGAERAGDDVLGNVERDLVVGHLAGGTNLPDQAVIEGQLLQLQAAEAVGPAIADVGHHGPLGQQRQRRAGGAHALEVVAGLAALVDQLVGVLRRPCGGPRAGSSSRSFW